MGPSGTAASLLPLLLLPLLALGAQAALPLPDYVRPCSLAQSDRKASECGTKHAREVLPHVLKGDPKYNVPVLDPLYIDRLAVINDEGSLGMKLIASDVYVYGIPDTIIENIIHQSNPLQDTYVLTIPNPFIRAKYNVTGRVLLLPISGQGNCELKFKNLKLIYQFNSKLETLEDGEVYFVPQPGARLDADVDGMTIHLDNLFNGDKALVENTNKFLNENWREAFESLKPSFADSLAKIMFDVLNGIFIKVPFKEAFLDTDKLIKKS